ncbi:hypothetical protein IEQ34_015503 [Dendrobium chrysotoxum]|uniref:Uncharacterized protein n=1 Tax=Dendrobium chrysotoxum TaxID=161865 RepID=A0AAV7GGC8_DENCH|nr:hypothetical protein IEQ34_015503 [Dendrobium chrysotoxum]
MGDSLIALHKKFHIPNDMVTMVPKTYLSPSGHLTIYEANLQAGLHFPPPAELIEISKRYGVTYRAILVTVGLITLFRDRGAILMPKHLLLMG